MKNITPKRPEIEKTVTDELKKRLESYFRPHNALLAEMLGWDPGW